MTLIHRYIGFAILRAFVMALIVLLFVFALGTAFKLLRDDLTGMQLLRVLPFALLYTLPYLLPVALLTATSLTYGRLVANQEILAMRASGISPLQIMAPGLVPGLLLTLVGFSLESSVIPTLRHQRDAIASTLIEEFLSLGRGEHKTFRMDDSGLSLYLRRFEGGTLEGIILRKKDGTQDLKLVARRGAMRVDAARQVIILDLEDVRMTLYEARDARLLGFSRVRLEEVRQEIPIGGQIDIGSRDLPSREVLRLYDKMRAGRETYALSGFVFGATGQFFQDRRVLADLVFRFVTPWASIVFVLIAIPIALMWPYDNALFPFLIAFLAATLFFFVPYLIGKSLAGKGEASLWLLGLGPACGMLAGLALTVIAGRR